MKTVILMSGKMRSGKNQLAEYIQTDLENKGIAVAHDLYARSLKDGCREDFRKLSTCLSNIYQEIKANTTTLFSSADFRKPEVELRLRDIEKSLGKLLIKDDNWYEDKTDITRNILQLYGTEIFRKRVDTDWWAKQVRNRAINSELNDVVIVTDCRFPNEIEVFSKDVTNLNINLVLIRVNRSINTPDTIANHDSETSLDNWTDWTYIVNNDGTLQDLQNASKTIVTDLIEEYEYVVPEIP